MAFNQRKRVNKNHNKKTDNNINKEKNMVFSYSTFEQKRHKIKGPVGLLMDMILVFPFVILVALIYSGMIKKIPAEKFKLILVLAAVVLILIMLLRISIWINDVFHVFIIDKNGNFYRLRVSTFWYKLKDKMYLLTPANVTGKKFMMLIYMVANMKNVVDSISDSITYDELIAMGKLEKLTDISELKVSNGIISFRANISEKNESSVKKIRCHRLYENDFQLIRFLSGEDYREKEDSRKIIEELFKEQNSFGKILKFTKIWTCILEWVAVTLLSSDFSRMASINSGDYKKQIIETDSGKKKEAYVSVTDSNDYFYASSYGKLFKPVMIIYLSVEIIYIFSKGTDIVIAKTKKEEI